MVFFLSIEHKLKFEFKLLFIISYILVIFLNYSRATFVSTGIVFAGYFYFWKFKNTSMVSKVGFYLLVISTLIFFWYSNIDFINYLFENDVYRQHSNSIRLELSYKGLIELNSLFKVFFGLGLGINTGFSDQKILGDGAIVSLLLDGGLLLFFLFLSYMFLVYKRIIKFISSNSLRMAISFSFLGIFVGLAINSGFFENINIQLFPFIIYVIYYNYPQKLIYQRKI
jgi:hypothetical protein